MKLLRNISLALLSVMALSCDKFLDEMPDNRAEVNNQTKIRALLSAAYPTSTYLTFNEYMSDNVDNIGDDNPGTDRFVDQCYKWEHVTEVANDCPTYFWSDCYMCIAHANQALIAIRELSGVTDHLDPDAVVAAGLEAEMAEALICRAYGHFMLVNEFCLNYNELSSLSDPGIPYMETAETQLNPKYERGTVNDVYVNIDKDITLALKYISDKYYRIPKYHFNVKAAYAFATRFYLFWEKWDKAAECASKCLGSQPSAVLRNWEAMSRLEKDREVRSTDFVNSSYDTNLLLVTGYTNFGLYFGYPGITKYTHDSYLSFTEVAYAQNIWGNTATGWHDVNEWFWVGPEWYNGSTFDQIAYWKVPRMFEYTDPVAQIGYAHSVCPAFTMEEVLLSRAEAYVMLGRYDDAAADMSTFIHSIIKGQYFSSNLTPESIQNFYKGIKYATWDYPTIKKHLHPSFDIGEEGSVRESMIQCVLQLRRIDNIAQGLRWFDVRRYGIEIWRRTMQPNTRGQQYDASFIPMRLDDVLTVDDERRALELPDEVIKAGMTPNRKTTNTGNNE